MCLSCNHTHTACTAPMCVLGERGGGRGGGAGVGAGGRVGHRLRRRRPRGAPLRGLPRHLDLTLPQAVPQTLPQTQHPSPGSTPNPNPNPNPNQVCLGYLDQCVTAPCMHRFCQGCVEKWIRIGQLNCPECKQAVKTRRSFQRDARSALQPYVHPACNHPTCNHPACNQVPPACNHMCPGARRRAGARAAGGLPGRYLGDELGGRQEGEVR